MRKKKPLWVSGAGAVAAAALSEHYGSVGWEKVSVVMKMKAKKNHLMIRGLRGLILVRRGQPLMHADGDDSVLDERRVRNGAMKPGMC